MDFFNYHDNQLFAEDVDLNRIIEKYGTPCFVYSRATLEKHWHAFDETLKGTPHQIHYAVKANSNLAVLDLLNRKGAGFDIVSGGELARLKAVNANLSKVIFSGVGKTPKEIRLALDAGIHCFNVESKAELTTIADIAKAMGKSAPIALRVNPNVSANSHPFITTGTYADKFGISIDEIHNYCQEIHDHPHLQLLGLTCHLGSQMMSVSPILDALDKLLIKIDELAKINIHLQHINLGGGLGVRYLKESPPLPHEYIEAILSKLATRNLPLYLEPGRAIMANAGILLTEVLYLKETANKNFAIVDAATNDLMRPALYDAYHDIIPLQKNTAGEVKTYDVVGPICESSDILGKDRQLCLKSQDKLAIRTAGAYAASMGSNYNSRTKIPEIMVDGQQYHLIRQGETWEDLYRLENVLP